MDFCHKGLLLDTAALASLAEAQRPIFIHEWLRHLDKILPTAPRNDVKTNQKLLVAHLMSLVQGGPGNLTLIGGPGPPTRDLLGKCLSTLFTVGDTFLLFETINKCNDVLKNKDDSPSVLPSRLAAITVLGHMYQTLGRMTGRSFEETVQSLTKGLKNAESQTRLETMITLGKVCSGLGSAATHLHRDMYKVLRSAMSSDRVMAVRAAAATSIMAMAPYANFIINSELENLATMCFKAFDGANYVTRKAIAKCLGNVLAMTQQNMNNRQGMIVQTKKGNIGIGGNKILPLEDALSILMQGFLKGGSGSGLIKGISPVNQEVRVGVTHCYVIMVQTLGSNWLEKHLSQVMKHVLELAAHPKAATNHVDAVYSRKCVGYILQILLGKMLGEKTQLSACKELLNIIEKLIGSVDISPDNIKDTGNSETMFSQHQLVASLQELGTLFLRLGTATRTLLFDNHLRLTEVLFSTLLHPCQAPRLAGAFCLRSLCIAVPSHLSSAIDRCLEGLEKYKSSTEALSGYSAASAALLGAVRITPLGIPHTRGKFIFNIGEELLRTASQNSRLSRERTQAGWTLIAAIMTLGPAVVKGLLPRMMLLWRNAFPRSPKELESEKSRGDAFTWKVSLEARAGAMASIHAFLSHASPTQIHTTYSDLINDDVLRRLSVPVEACLNLCANMGPIVKAYPAELKALTAMLRLRLYEVLTLLPATTLEGSFPQLLRLLVGEFTLADGQSNTSTSLLRSFCHADDAIILGTHFQDADEKVIEEQLLANSAAGSGALEHDICSLFRPIPKGSLFSTPGPLPLGVYVVDQSIIVFGYIFPKVAQKHRLQMLEHFSEHIKQAQVKSKNVHGEAVQLNIFTAVLSSLKGLVESKSKFGNQEEVKKSAVKLIMGALSSSNSMLRCSAGEALGRMAQVVQDAKFVADTAQASFDCLKTSRDVISRTGHSLALGCLHRYVGGMGSSQHLNTSVSILIALAQDQASPEVQVWALHALALIADSGGPMFRGFVEPTLSTLLKLLLNVQSTSLEVFSCIGRVLSALITTVGPELQSSSVAMLQVRNSFICASAILQKHQHPVIQSEAITCLQQLHMFTSTLSSTTSVNIVDLATLVPNICKLLKSSHLVLRKSAVSCLRQLAQREAREVCEIALTMINSESIKDTHNIESVTFTETGLPGMLFSILDHEMDATLLSNVHDTLTFIMQAMAAQNLTTWLSLLREVLTISSDNLEMTGQKNLLDDKDEDNSDVADDCDEFTTGEEVRDNIQPRWPTRVFAAECLRKIIQECCSGDRAHYDLGLAKEMELSQNKGDYLVLHLSELVRVAFMAATSESDPLRLEGLKTLEVIIEKFGDTAEPEFPGHVILEQYQAQVGAALRPAFTPDTPSHVTAAACNVCSTWISSGVARDLSDLRRVYQLLVTSLEKMKPKNSPLYNESALTLEKLSILKAWAEVYIVSMKNEIENDKIVATPAEDFDEFADNESSNNPIVKEESLATLVQEELPTLSKHWLAALKDNALLSLPSEFKSQLPFDGGAFYTNDTIENARPHYKACWSPILEASAVWLSYGRGFDHVLLEKTDLDVQGSSNLGLGPANATASKSPENINRDRFFLLFGTCLEALSNNRSAEMSKEDVVSCLKTLLALLNHSWIRKEILGKSPVLTIELTNVLHRTVLTRDHTYTQILVMEVVKLIIVTSSEHLDMLKRSKQKEMELPANKEPNEFPELSNLGEGGEDGEIIPGKSVVFSVLEVCLCVLVRHYPELSQRASNLSSLMAIQAKSRLKGRHLTEEQSKLIAISVEALSKLPELCSPRGALKILPSILWLHTGVLRKASYQSLQDDTILTNSTNEQTTATLQGFKKLIIAPYSHYEISRFKWRELLQSTLLRILDLAKTAPEDTEEEEKIDQMSLLLAVTVFILHCPPEVVCSPNIQYPAINTFTQCFQSENPLVRHRSVQAMHSVFKQENKTISQPYIKSLLPKVIEFLSDESSRIIKTELDLRITLECTRIVEMSILNLPESDNKSQMLSYLISILVCQLLDKDNLKDAVSSLRLKLHEFSLAKITQIGMSFPKELKEVMTKYPEMKTRLESAVLANQAKKQTEKKAVTQNNMETNRVHEPSIKLKMDFSNFAAKK